MNAIRSMTLAGIVALAGCARPLSPEVLADKGCMRPSANSGLEAFDVSSPTLLDAVNSQVFGPANAATLARSGDMENLSFVVRPATLIPRMTPQPRTVREWNVAVCGRAAGIIQENARHWF